MSRLRELSELLRDQSKWPEGFVWDYSDTCHCAIGLACESGLAQRRNILFDSECVAIDLGVPDDAFGFLFMAQPWDGGWASVTPEMIADRIDCYLAARPVPCQPAQRKAALDSARNQMLNAALHEALRLAQMGRRPEFEVRVLAIDEFEQLAASMPRITFDVVAFEDAA